MIIHELYTDAITTVGNVKRVNFYFRVEKDDGENEWHYFGTDPADKPPTTQDPVFEHALIQFPKDLDEIPESTDGILYEIALKAGLRKEGIEVIETPGPPP